MLRMNDPRESNTIASGGNQNVQAENTGDIVQGNDGSSITQPSFSPLTGLGNNDSRDGNSQGNNTGIFEAVDAVRSELLQLVRSEMRVIADALRHHNNANNRDSNNQNLNWPQDLPRSARQSNPNNSNAHNAAEVQNNLPTAGNSTAFHRYQPKYPQISKWGITFDGTEKTMQVEDFIFRAEKLQFSYNCPWDEVIKGFHHLLDGQASKWYCLHIKDRPNINWQNMKLDIVQKFQMYHSNMDVLRKIMDRIQLREEKCTSFIDAILNLRNQLREPLSDYQLVDITNVGKLKIC